MKPNLLALRFIVLPLFLLFLLPRCPPTFVTIKGEGLQVAVGESLQLEASSTDAGDKLFEWASLNQRAAIVDETGTVTGLGLGQATITAKGGHSGRTGLVDITVVAGSGFNMSLPTDPQSVTPIQSAQNTLDISVCMLQTPGIAAEIRNENAVLYHRLKLSGTGTTAEEGKPELPFYTLYFAVPRDAQSGEAATWQATLEVASEQLLEGIRACPAQPPSWIEGDSTGQEGKNLEAPVSSRPEFTIDEAFYQSPGPYPQARIRSRSFDIGDLRIAEVRVLPAVYYPAARQLRLAKKMTVVVSFSSPNGTAAPAVVGDVMGREEPGAEEWVCGFLVNADQVRTYRVADLSHALSPLDTLTVHDDPFELLIVTRPELFSEAFEYGRWKQDQGIRVRLESLSEEIYPDAESIREYIRDLDADNWLPTPGVTRRHAMWALCLFGDAGIVPPCTGMNYRGYADPTDPGESLSIVGTDHLYSTVRNGDDLPDFAVGRISVEGEIQAHDVLTKIRRYERKETAPNHVSMYGYFKDEIIPLRALDGTAIFNVGSVTVTGTGTHFATQISTADFLDYLAINDPGVGWLGWFDVASVANDTNLVLSSPFNGAHDISGVTVLGGQDGQDDWEFVKAAERVRQFMAERGVTARFGYASETGPAPVRLYGGEPMAEDLLTYAWDATSADIQANWIEGLDGIVLHSDHGSRYGWQRPPFLRADIVALTDPENGFYPIVFSVNCDSGWFDNETDTRVWGGGAVAADTTTPWWEDCFCERLIRFADGGAVAAVGACRGTDACDNDKLVDGLFAGIYDDYVAGSILERHRPACTRLGSAFQWAKFHLFSVTEREVYDQYNYQVWHLFGDPALRINRPAP